MMYDEMIEKVHLDNGSGEGAIWPVSGCTECGALVYGRDEHAHWHRNEAGLPAKPALDMGIDPASIYDEYSNFCSTCGHHIDVHHDETSFCRLEALIRDDNDPNMSVSGECGCRGFR